MLANYPEEPTLPGFMMVDDPDELPNPAIGYPEPDPNAPMGIVEIRDYHAGMQLDGQPDILPIEPEFIPPRARPSGPTGLGGTVRYEARIQVLEAYQYPGTLKDAPPWVDRNWVGYAPDFDPLRGIEPGPALRVPTRSGEVVLCRPGDYVVMQSVTLVQGIEPDVVVEVWARESFEKNFLPVRSNQRQTHAGALAAPAA